MTTKPTAILLLLCLLACGCQSGQNLTSHAVLHHEWVTPLTADSGSRTEEIELRDYEHRGAFLGSHHFVDDDGNHVRVEYYADLDWTGERIFYPNGQFRSWRPHAADVRLSAVTHQINNPFGEWVAGPAIRLAVTESYSMGAALLVVAQCTLADRSDNPLTLPLEIMLWGNGDTLAHGFGEPTEDLLPENVRFTYGNLPRAEFAMTISDGTSAWDGSDPGNIEVWTLTDSGWINGE